MPTPTTQPEPPEYPQILAGLRRIEQRLRLAEAARLAPLALSLGLVGAVALALVARVQPIAPWPDLLAVDAGTVAALLLAVGIWAWVRRRGRLDTARQGDRVLDLDERLSTAVETREQPRPMALDADAHAAHATLVHQQLRDTTDRLGAALPTLPQAVPLAPPAARRIWLVPLVLVLALALATFAPNPMDAFWQQQAQVQQQIKEEQQRIEELRKDLAARPGDPNDPTRQQLLQELQDLQQALGAGDLTREEALAQLSDTESKLQQLVDAQAPGEKAALDALGRQLAQSDNPAARQAAEALKNNRPDAAAEALKGLDPSQMTGEQRQALADSLRQAAQDAAANDPNLAQRLNDAAQALESSDPAAAQKALENLANQVDQTGQHTLSQQEVDQALAQLQQSKGTLAQASQPTPQAQNGTPGPTNGTPQAQNGTPFQGTPVAPNGTQIALNGTPISISGTQVALNGTPISGTPAGTGTPVLVAASPGQGTPVIVPGQGQGQPGQGQGQGQTGQPGQGQGQGQGPGIGSGHTEPLTVPPSTLNAQGTPVGLAARPGTGDTNTGSVNVDPNAGSVQVPYADVYGSYAAQAQQTLGQEYVPSGMKEYVQQYFTSLAPPGP